MVYLPNDSLMIFSFKMFRCGKDYFLKRYQ